jgi:hypothetical protein
MLDTSVLLNSGSCPEVIRINVWLHEVMDNGASTLSRKTIMPDLLAVASVLCCMGGLLQERCDWPSSAAALHMFAFTSKHNFMLHPVFWLCLHC